MPRYKVNQRYGAFMDGLRFNLLADSEVDLTAVQAAWINRDSPGTLSSAEPDPADDADASDGAEPGADPTADETGTPTRNRKHTPARTRA